MPFLPFVKIIVEECLNMKPLSSPTNRRTFLKESVASAALIGLKTGGFAQGNASPIKVGQIGTAHAHASGKWQAMKRCEDFEIVGLAEVDEEHAHAVRAASNVYADARWMSVESLLAVPDLRMIAVETHVRDLLAIATRCLQAGKHIHLDKPAGSDLALFKRVVDLARSHRLLIQMGYMFRYNPAFEFCFRAVREGWLGDIFAVEAVMGKKSGSDVRKELAEFDGGTMFELGCHVIDAIVYMLGKPDQVHAFNRKSIAGDPLVDNQLAVLEYPHFAVTVRSALIEVDGFARRQLVVCGNKGTLEIRPLEPPSVRLTLEESVGGYKKGAQKVVFPGNGRYDKDFEDIARVMRGQRSFQFSYEHDLAVQETVLRASGMM